MTHRTLLQSTLDDLIRHYNTEYATLAHLDCDESLLSTIDEFIHNLKTLRDISEELEWEKN